MSRSALLSTSTRVVGAAGFSRRPEVGENRGGKVPSGQVVRREGYQFGWRTEAEAGCEGAEDRCLESEATLVVGIKLMSMGSEELQIDGLEQG